jgi:ubiquinone/menaquinone biosynthesis C-methylase UbiE
VKRRFDPEDPELMDRPQPVTDALRRDLANLRQLNAAFGARRILRAWARGRFRAGESLVLVDFCTGSGDLPVYLVECARRLGCRLKIHAVDFHPSTLAIAREQCAGYEEIVLHEGDARLWQPPEPVDYVLCSLALHHFSIDDAEVILRRMRSLARHGVYLADLERAWWACLGIDLASWFYREPMTVEDMRRSARAAFSRSELIGLTERAGWTETTPRRFFYGRHAIWSP